MTLKEFFKTNPKIALGFSGGVDSSYLLYAAKKYNADIKGYYVKTAFQPSFEFNDAKKLADSICADMTVIELDILSHNEITENNCSRCYYCKRQIFGAVKKQAEDGGYNLMIDGTNASDDISDRPGIKAIEELSVRSPLRECGLTKADVRRLSKEAGLFTWNKPSYSCLATRIPTNEPITKELLCKIERAEDILFKMGFSDFRVRICHGAARLQVTESDMGKIISHRNRIYSEFSELFNSVFLDLKER